MIELPLQHEHHHDHDHDHQHTSHDHNQHEQESNLSEIPCHPHRPVASFDFSGIEEQIQAIKRKKAAAQLAASLLKKPKKLPNQIYEADVIEEALEESIDMVPSYISVALKHRLKYIEDKVYIGSQNERQGELVSRLKQQVLSNEALSNELNLVMDHVQISIENDIEEGSYDIHSIKHAQKRPPPQPEPAHRVKLKNMMIKSKLMDLKEEFSHSEIGNTEHIRGSAVGSEVNSSRVDKKQGQIWGDQFHLLSQGTRKAQSFVKKLQKEQLQQRKERIRKNNELQSLEVKSAMEHKQFQQQMKKEKHQSLKKRYQQTRQEKKALKAKQEMNEKEYAQFLKEYQGKKPLFRIKQQQYLQNVIEEQERKRKSQLMEIHDAKKPMSHEELLQHQKNYEKWKEEKHAQMLVEREFKKKQEAGLPRKSFYRGKFHSLIMQEKEERHKKVADPQQAKQAMLKKQKQFAQQVRKKFAPLISQAKKKQLSEMMVALQKGKNQKALSQQQYRQLGNDYLKQVHKMIEQLRAKGLVKTQEKEETKPKAKDYLKEMRDRYNFSTVDYSSQVDSNSQWVENKALKHEKDAKMKQKVLKFKSHGDFDFERHMREVDNINNDYINSAEAKISLINKLEKSNNNQTASKPRSEVQSSQKSMAKKSKADYQSQV